MKFNSAQEMLDVIKKGTDLYNPNTNTYVFVYSDAGSIAYYRIDNEEAKELERKAREADEYWGAFLGPGGWIVDDPSSDFFEGNETNLEWCEACYKDEGWIECKEVLLDDDSIKLRN